MKALVHFLDGAASVVLGIALTIVFLDAVKLYNALIDDAGAALWVYSILTMAAAGWAIYRRVFGRSLAI